MAVLSPQTNAVGDHGHKLAVGRFAAGAVDGVAEEGVQHVHIAAIPCHLNGMADLLPCWSVQHRKLIGSFL